MRRITLLHTVFIVPSALAVASLAMADLPRSLNFANETSGRINPNQSEGSSNEKEVEFGDLDLDGDPDMIIAVGSADFGERKNKIYFNDGGVFTEASGTFIPEFAMADVSRNAFIRDYTGDGWPDIYIINDSNSGGFAGSDKIYIAQHAGGVLTGYSQENSTRIPSQGALGAACGGVSADFDEDGDQDVYSGNYPGPSQDRGLYNGGTGFLSDLTSTLVPPDSDYTVDIALADMNGDGNMDLLISNDFDPNFIYYNDNNGAGSGTGDFFYTGSTQNLGTAGAGENAMEPADFDNDGDQDILWTNRVGSSGDRILRNNGNDGNNKATFTELNILPPSVASATTRKTSVADFNDDGRLDCFVASQSGSRPAVLRNTSVNGEISFVDWSPRLAFPSNNSLNGWHGAVFDTNADGDTDIVIGAFSGDHLIENVPANEVDENDLGGGGSFPAVYNLDPVALLGHGGDGAVDEYLVTGLASGFMSIVLNGPDDYRLELVNSGGSVIATSDRGGLGIEEAFQRSISAGNHTIRVTVLETDSSCGPPDLDGDCEVGFSDLLLVLSNWGCTTCPDLDLDDSGTIDFGDLLMILSNWGPLAGGGVNDYLLEVLARSN